jgi:hypothetical protein
MNLERYEIDMYEEDAQVQYEFFSQGPNGIIKKFIRFDKFSDDFYNLSFGDSIAGTEDYSDEIISNNGDTEKVLTTVAEAIMQFSATNPTVMIHAEGSTPARSRLYRICLNKHRKVINKHFHIYGKLMNEEWEKFKKNGNYIALAVMRKNPYF